LKTSRKKRKRVKILR